MAEWIYQVKSSDTLTVSANSTKEFDISFEYTVGYNIIVPVYIISKEWGSVTLNSYQSGTDYIVITGYNHTSSSVDTYFTVARYCIKGVRVSTE